MLKNSLHTLSAEYLEKINIPNELVGNMEFWKSTMME